MTEEAKKMDSISEDFIEKAIGSVSDEEVTEIADAVAEAEEHDEAPPEEANEPESVETSAETTAEVQEEVPGPSWTFDLSDIPDKGNMIIEEFGQQSYMFQRVSDPADETTDKFLVFCKDANIIQEGGAQPWVTLPGVLTNRYTAASIEKFVSVIEGQLESVEDQSFLHVPFKNIWSGITEKQIEYFSDEVAKMLFALVSGADIESVDNLTSKIKIIVTNSYDGSKSLRLDYAVSTAGKAKNAETGEVNDLVLNDYLNLCNISHTIVHMGHLTEISSDLANIQSQIDSSIAILKEYDLNLDQIFDQIIKCFRKDGRELLGSYFENLIGDYRKLYYLLLVTSITMDRDYNVNEHFKVRSVVDKIFNRIFRTNV